MDITVKQMQSLTYRKDRLRQKLQKLEFLLSGKGKSFLPLVQTKTGRHSEKRTWALVEDLLSALEKYEAYKQWQKDYDSVTSRGDGDFTLALSAAGPQLTEQAQDFWRGFLYCAIRFAGSHPVTGLPNWGIIEMEGTFEDIVSLAGQVEHVSKAELHFAELYQKYLPGFFGWMDALYRQLAGRPMAAHLSEADRRTVRELFPAEVEQAERLQAEEEGLDQQEINKSLAEADREWRKIMGISDEEWQQEAEEAELSFQVQEDWFRSFPNKESFCVQYLAFHDLFFQADCRRDFCSAIEHAIDIYLYEHDASGYLDDDTFFSAYGLVDKVVRQMQEFSEAEDSQ